MSSVGELIDLIHGCTQAANSHPPIPRFPKCRVDLAPVAVDCRRRQVSSYHNARSNANQFIFVNVFSTRDSSDKTKSTGRERVFCLVQIRVKLIECETIVCITG